MWLRFSWRGQRRQPATSADGRTGTGGRRPDLETNGEKFGLSSLSYDTTPDNTYVKDSIRRLGGIVTNERPVSTLLGDDFKVQAGFKTGVSIFDRKLMFRPPVGFPERRRPKRIAVVTKEVIQ